MAKPKAEIIKRPIERMGTNVKKTAWSSMMESFVTLVLGILFIVWPDTMIQLIAYIIGIVFVVKGCFDVLVYFMDKRNVYSNLLLSGVVAALIGVAALIAGPNIADVFRIVVGIFLIYEALSKLNSAIKLYYAKIGLWKIVAVLALVMLVLGVFVTFNDTAAVIGWAMVAAGCMGIVGDIMFIQQVDRVVEVLTSPFKSTGGTSNKTSKKASSK